MKTSFLMATNYAIPTLIHVLQDEQISQAHIMALRRAGLYTVEKVADTTSITLSKILNCDMDFATEVLGKAYSKLPSTWFQTSQELRISDHKAITISTGSDTINKLLNGGVALGEVIELFGESGSGKTQFSLTMCITVQESLKGCAILIDTRRCLRPERLLEIAEARNISDYNNALDNVFVIQPRTSEQLLDALHRVKEYLKTNWIPLIIIDSVTGPLRSEYPMNSNLDERQRKLGVIMTNLRNIAEEFLIAVVVTNSSYASFNYPFSQVPYGGAVMESGATTRLHLSKSSITTHRTCKIYQSAHLPPESGEFIIGKGGVI